jgi:hypothetical protein
MRLIGKILPFCLFLFLGISCYSQNSTTNIPPSITYTNFDLQSGFNYYHGKYGLSSRLMYDYKPKIKFGISLDYIDNQLYQSSGNASIGQKIDSNIGEFEIYLISGAGFSLKDHRAIGIVGTGICYQTPLYFKIRGKYIFMETGGEIDSYSSLTYPVFKQFFGFRIRF